MRLGESLLDGIFAHNRKELDLQTRLVNRTIAQTFERGIEQILSVGYDIDEFVDYAWNAQATVPDIGKMVVCSRTM